MYPNKNLNLKPPERNICRQHFCFDFPLIYYLVITSKLKFWGQGTYDPAHALLGFGARVEEGICRGRMGKGRSVEWNSRG